jgi:hypothetical protein
LFSGEGGAGKSLRAEQLCTAATLTNKEWFGVVPWHGHGIVFDAEEPGSIMENRGVLRRALGSGMPCSSPALIAWTKVASLRHRASRFSTPRL